MSTENPSVNGYTTPPAAGLSNLALTEYTAAPTPQPETENRILGLPNNWGIPDSFILPNGYPDVSGVIRTAATGRRLADCAPCASYSTSV